MKSYHINSVARLSILALLVTASCAGEDEPRVCTVRGCGSPTIILTLTHAQGSPVGAFSGEVTIGQTVHNITCTDSISPGDERISCEDNLLTITHDSVPSELAVNLRAESDPTLAAIGAIAITRVTLRPNGEDCPPECEAGTGQVRFETTQAAGP